MGWFANPHDNPDQDDPSQEENRSKYWDKPKSKNRAKIHDQHRNMDTKNPENPPYFGKPDRRRRKP